MKYSLLTIHSSLKYTLLVIGLLFATANSNAAISWQTINNNIQFLKQQDDLRFYDSNQVLIEGAECALLVDTSGNFAGVEQLVVELKKRLKTPLCYLVATHYHDDHLLGMAVVQLGHAGRQGVRLLDLLDRGGAVVLSGPVYPLATSRIVLERAE